MAVLAGLGGYLAARFSVKVNQRTMRWAVAMIGLATAGYFFVQNSMTQASASTVAVHGTQIPAHNGSGH
jgi:hypothetical protein